jgi:hypothetical protein
MFLKLIFGILIFYLVYCGLLFLMQRRMVFPRGVVQMPEEIPAAGPGLEKSWLEISSGRVEAWYLPPKGNEEPVPGVVFAHGNAEFIDHWVNKMQAFARLGMGVLLVEYPGYGRSEGSPSQEGVTQAMVAGYDALLGRPEIDGKRVVLIGRSLGAGSVCALAALRPAAAMVLLSTFTSIRAMAKRYLIPKFLVLDPFDNLSVVRNFAGPILVAHSPKDSIIPYWHAEALYRASRQGKMMVFETCDHADCPDEWDIFVDEVADFLADSGVWEGPNGVEN